MPGSGWKRLFVADDRVRGVWRILAFLGLFVIFSVLAALLLNVAGVPLVAGGLLWQGAATLAAALAAGGILIRRLDGRPAGALGFARTAQVPRELGGGMAIGAGALAAVAATLTLAGMIDYGPDAGGVGDLAAVLVADLLVLGVAAASEEALFRGYPFQVLVEGIGPVAATLLLSAAFAAAHAANPNVGVFALVNIFLAGVLLSVAYLRTRSLWFATAVHLGWNWAMASVFDLPVSGLELFETPLYDAAPTGPEWLTGGAFGPEGGLAGTVGFLVALIAVAKLPYFREAAEMRALRPLVDGRL